MNIGKHSGGRPVKLTDIVIESILANIKKGLTLKAACKGLAFLIQLWQLGCIKARFQEKMVLRINTLLLWT